jgi:hypothetical protein
MLLPKGFDAPAAYPPAFALNRRSFVTEVYISCVRSLGDPAM